MFLIKNDGVDAISGTFNGITDGSTILFGSYQASISYFGNAEAAVPTFSGGNDVVLFNFLPVPEPTTMFALAGLTLIVCRTVRRKRV